MKIAIVTSRKDPDNLRARMLRAGFSECINTEVLVIKNDRTGIGRSWQTIYRLFKDSFKESPDAYVVTYRGYGILPFVLIVSGHRPVIFDEFINPIERLVFEKHKFKPNSLFVKMLKGYYKFLVKRCKFILADTDAHAEYSAKINSVSLAFYKTLPLTTDEHLFHPTQKTSSSKKSKEFSVFYFGSTVPINGLVYILEAAQRLGEIPAIKFIIAGNSKLIASRVRAAVAKGANIHYRDDITLEKLPRIIREQSVALAGPFGNTVEAKLTVTNRCHQIMACSVPAIIGKSKVRGIFEDLKDTIMVQQGSSKALADAIMWAFEHKRQLGPIARHGRKTYEEFFSNKAIANHCQMIVDQIF